MRRVALASLVLLLAGAAAAEPAPRGWTWVVRPTPDLASIHVEMRFDRYPAVRLLSRAPAALAAIDPDAGAAGLRVDAEAGAVLLDAGPGAPGLGYTVDLGRLARVADRGVTAHRVGGDVVLDPGVVLLRPAVWAPDAVARVRFELPEGLAVASGWPALGAPTAGVDERTVAPEALDREGVLAIGRFAPWSVEVAGARLDVAILDAPHALTPEGAARWLEAAAGAVATVHGRFPVPRAQVLVWPRGRGRTPVSFGRTFRSGGDLVVLYVSPRATDDAFPGEWVAVHEMLHLGMPGTTFDDWWLQEGFVTWHQEVARTRAGFQSVEEGWRQLDEGFARGRRVSTGRTLQEESRRMHETHAYWRVYWAGAAIALLCDLEIRRVTGGRRCLDQAVRFLRARHPDWTVTRPGLELLAEVDAWLGSPVCVPIARPLLASATFPDLTAAYARLGLVVEDGRLRFAGGPEEAALRDAIMRPR